MNNEKVLELVNSIDANIRELAKVTGEGYLIATLANGDFMLSGKRDENGQRKIDFYKPEA